ncbi:hypothetical protein QBC34DRAFT_42919 [Podospora aff. communis PSN243]|uniref:Uncharacterized protein n=1 Tax=Podospora aff. communis PSN243 TaxID=3040156 RepID=A0AAV9G2P8_9PEZI|nr:hypothetical protein QBC34DRAFT_42919 [Podospora aff. communis PSN243]
MRSAAGLSALAALISCISAVPAPSNSNTNLEVPRSDLGPAWLLREDLPADAVVYGLDEDPLASRDAESSPNPANLLKRSDCNGSSSCYAISGSTCVAASNRYGDGNWYCGYTSRIKHSCEGGCAGCTAIFTCSNHGGACWAGWYLKTLFAKIYGEVGCGICGSYTWSEGAASGCRVTYNYCGAWSCNDRG